MRTVGYCRHCLALVWRLRTETEARERKARRHANDAGLRASLRNLRLGYRASYERIRRGNVIGFAPSAD